MDGLRQHYYGYYEDGTYFNRTHLIQQPAHSSDQTQSLDLLFFGNLKGVCCQKQGMQRFLCTK